MIRTNPIRHRIGAVLRAGGRSLPLAAMAIAAWSAHPALGASSSGIGASAAGITVAPSAIGASAPVGTVATATLKVTNSGNSDLHVTPRAAENAPGAQAVGKRKVLFLVAGATYSTAFSDSVKALPNVESLDIFEGTTATPTLAYLQGFSTVIVAANTSWSSPSGVGDVLADYIDAGGAAILLGATFHTGGGWTLQGRIMNAAYAPIAAAAYSVSSASLSTLAAHPINQGVATLTTGLYAMAAATQGTGKPLGTYTGNYLIGAYNPDKRVVSLNAFVEAGYYGGDFLIQVRNTLDFLAKGIWLSVAGDGQPMVVPPGGSADVAVTLDATFIPGGNYAGSISLTHDDPASANPLVIPVSFSVQSYRRLAVSPSALAFGNRRMGSATILSVTLTNAGDLATALTGLSIDGNPAFKIAGTPPASVPGGKSIALAIEYRPDALGPQSAALSIASDAQDAPSLTVSLSGMGTASPSAVLDPSSFTLTLAPSQAPADRTATLSNVGGDVLSWRIASIAQTGSPLPASASSLSATAAAGTSAGAADIIPPVRADLIYAAANYAHAYAPGRVIVGFKPGQSDFAASAAAASLGIKKMRELARAVNPRTKRKAQEGRKLMLLELQDRGGVARAIQALMKDPNVAYAEPDYIQKAVAIPNDPSFSQLYGMHNTGQTGGTPDADIDAPEAWDRHTGNRSLTIGIIDTGIDYLHPELAANIWTNPGEIAGNGIDDDGNGYIDDIHGWDFAYDDNNPMDGHYHGTHVAGTIAAIGNNGAGVAGVMWTASLAALKFLSDSGSGTTSDAIDAVNYAKAMGFKITSNSWGGGGFSQALMDAIAAGGLFVAAAGNAGTDNDATPSYPASYPLDNIISVAATDHTDALASFSCFGKTSVDLGAPGVNVYSTSPNNTYRTLSGTSMATPHVSGAAGLVWTYNPTLTAAQVKDALLSSVDPDPALNGKTVSGGRLNVNRALDKAGPSWLTASPMTPGTLTAGASTPITVTVNPAGLVAGQWTGVVNVATDDPAHPQLPIAVTANITGCRSLELKPASYDFGNRFVGSTTAFDLILHNACNDAVTVSAFTRSNPAFNLGGTLPLTVPAFKDVAVPVQFQPTQTGTVSGALILATDTDAEPFKTLVLTGTGVPPPVVSVNPASVSRTLASGTSAKVDFEIDNTGGSDLTWTLSNVTKGLEIPAVYPASHFAPQDRDLPDTRVGNPVTMGSGGPDAFGYRWIDSDQPGGPAYQWQDIKATGAPVLQNCLDCNIVKPLSFSFPLYGKSFTQMNITSKGWVNFGTTGYQYNNYPVPSTSMPNYLVAAFFDDLTTANGGAVYFQDFGDRAVIQWDNVGFYSGTGTLTFQIVLKADGTILYYYENMNGSVLSGTTGVQNGDATVGLQVQYNTAYVKNKLAVQINTLPAWLQASLLSGTIPAGGSQHVDLTLDASGLAGGAYSQTMVLAHNDPAQSSLKIPVSLSVTGIRKLSATPASLAFGNVFVGGQKILKVTLSNAGSQATQVTALSTGNPEFAATTALPLTIPPFQSATVDVRFSPADAGPETGTLSIASDAEDNPSLTVGLSGTGVAPAAVSVKPASVSRSLSAGASVKVDLEIDNTGGSDLTWALGNVNKGAQAQATYDASHFAPQDRNLPDLRVGNPVALGAGGPDASGYRWIDSDQPGGPAYQWQDIKATGTPVLQNCLDCNIVKPLSFAFRLYGTTFTQLNITSKGWVNFGTAGFQYTNYPLPGISMPNYLVAAFFDDLTTANGGAVYFQDFGDRAVIQWDNVGFYSGTGTLTFQIVLKADGTILYYYENMNGSVLSGTTGIQNGDATVGLQVQYNTAYVKNKLAVQISALPAWLQASLLSGTIPAGGNQHVELTLNAAGLNPGVYTQTMILTHNDPAQPPLPIPVTLTVEGIAGASRVLRIGPAALAAADGSRFHLWNMTVGGETRGLAKGTKYVLYLK